MNKKRKVVLLISLNALIFMGLLFIPVKAIETYGWEYFNESKHESKLKFQTDVVYVDTTQEGVCPYGIWIYGRNYEDLGGFSTRVYVKFYVMVQYEKILVIPRRPPTTYWGPAPDGFIKWQGEYDYDASGPGTWRWTVGVSAYSFQYSSSYTPNCVPSWKAKNSIADDYRYIGYFISRKSGDAHYFHALIKLHVVNKIATEWAHYKYFTDGYYEWVERIINVRIKVRFIFQWEFFGWHTSRTVNHILGDGAVPSPPGGGTDLSFIPLVEGTAG